MVLKPLTDLLQSEITAGGGGGFPVCTLVVLPNIRTPEILFPVPGIHGVASIFLIKL